MNKREIDWSGKEEGEAELLCYECGADFRTRSYFLRHRRAHRNAEICGVLMTEDSWRGMVGNDSDTEGGMMRPRRTINITEGIMEWPMDITTINFIIIKTC